MALEDLIMSQEVSDSPEETPEDRMRAALMQRLGVAPEVRARQMSDQMLGQGGKGFGGLMNRIFGGAAEGLRVAQDPKYRGAYQEALGAAMEQEKNLMPYARQLEMSGAMRDKAKLVAQEQARNTFAKVFDTITKSINTKYANETARSKALSQAKVDEAEIKQLLARGDYLGAQTKLLETQNKWLAETGAKELPKDVVSYGVLTGQKPGEEGFGKDFFSFERDKSIAKAAGPGILKFLGGGNRGGSTRVSESMRPVVTEDAAGRPIVNYVPVKSTSTITGGDQATRNPQALSALGISQDVIGKLGGAAQAPTQAPVQAPAQTPQSTINNALGIKKPPAVKIPAPVGSISSSPTTQPQTVKLEGFKTRAAAKENEAAMKTIGLTQDIRHNLGTKVADLADSMDAIKGNAFTLRMMKYGQAIKAVPEFKDAYQQMMADMMQNRVLERLAMTGKQTNMTEMGEISTYMPSIDDTFPQAISKSIRLEVLSKLAQKRKDENWISADQQFAPGRVTKIHDKILSLYNRAYEQKDPKERREMLKKIDKITASKILWKLATDPKADFLLEVK